MVTTRSTADEKKPLLQNGKTKADINSDQVLPSRSMNDIPEAPWIRARTDTKGRRMPQTISHRGYKAAWPENTMKAFTEAVGAGTHALETDIHLTRDDVVVLSHDPDLKRCFGRKEKVIECDWADISTLRTIREPPQPMPRLSELLEYLAQPELSKVWLMLDIKLDNDADKVMRLIASTIKSAPQPRTGPWTQRIVLGIWAAKFLPLCRKYLPDFAIANICFLMPYSRQFLSAPNVSFNMLQRAIVGPSGKRWIRDMKASNRSLISWTINDANLMKWCIQRDFDGVITDDPKLFNEIVDGWEKDGRTEPTARVTLRQWLQVLWIWIMIMIFSGRLMKKFPEKVKDVLEVNEGQLMRKASTDRTLDG